MEMWMGGGQKKKKGVLSRKSMLVWPHAITPPAANQCEELLQTYGRAKANPGDVMTPPLNAK